MIEVPPLQTRPKAALAGVGRHVILRPSVQKRSRRCSTSRRSRTSGPTSQRVLDAIDDLEPHASLELLRTLGGVLRKSDWKSRRCVCDEELIERRAGRHDRAPVRDRVRPRHDDRRRDAARPRDRAAGRGALDAQPPAAVRRRRDHPHLGDDDGRAARSTALRDARARDVLDATSEVLAERRGRARARSTRSRSAGNVTMMQLALGIDPEPLSMAPFVVATHEFPPVRAQRVRRRHPPARAGRSCSPSLGAYVGRRHRRRHARHGPDSRPPRCGCSSTSAPTARSRSARSTGCSRPPPRPVPRSRPPRSAAGCGPPRARSRASGSPTASCRSSVIGDVEPVGMCGSGLVDAVAELAHCGLLDHSGRFMADEEAAVELPELVSRLTKIGEERVFVLHWRTDDPSTSSSSRSATCASSSSPRRRSRPAGTSCSPSSASRRTR